MILLKGENNHYYVNIYLHIYKSIFYSPMALSYANL